jgi:hypothetical protein
MVGDIISEQGRKYLEMAGGLMPEWWRLRPESADRFFPPIAFGYHYGE